MAEILTKLRQILGTPTFYKLMPNGSGTSNSYQWDYGAMIEYLIAGTLLIIVVSSVFKFVRLLVK